MRRSLALAAAVSCLLAPTAAAQTGGAPAPSESGGTEVGTPSRAKPTARARLVASSFSVTPRTLRVGGAPARIAWRVNGRARRVRVRVEFVRAGDRRAAVRIRLGWKPTGVRRVHRWPLRPGVLPAGSYTARLHAVDDRGNVLARTARASGRSALRVVAPPPQRASTTGVFPVRGAWSWGGDDARFGASRGERLHQGQDLMAADGTPVVSPRAGYVYWRAYQESGAGHYLVVRGDDDRDYVFMHLKAGSLAVAREAPVAAGQVIAAVGNSGRSSGAHLHFEIWPNGWYAKDSKPIDPRPELEVWAAAAGTASAR